MAQLKIILGGGNPSTTLDIGGDTDALQMMRDVLEKDGRYGIQLDPSVDPNNPPSTDRPMLIDWQTAPDIQVVETFSKAILHSSQVAAKRRNPHAKS